MPNPLDQYIPHDASAERAYTELYIAANGREPPAPPSGWRQHAAQFTRENEHYVEVENGATQQGSPPLRTGQVGRINARHNELNGGGGTGGGERDGSEDYAYCRCIFSKYDPYGIIAYDPECIYHYP